MLVDLREYELHARLGTYRRRVDQTREYLLRHPKIVVSTSWGKDSVVLSDLAIETLGPVPLLHLGHSYGMPGYEETISHFEARTSITTIPSARSLAETIEWLRDVGLPHERTGGVQKQIVQTLKKDVGRDWCSANGFDAQALGLRADESKHRRKWLVITTRRHGAPEHTFASGLTVTYPLAWWTARDIWAHIVSRGLPYNRSIYDAETHGLTRERIRNTGWLSTDGAEHGRIAWLRAHFPAQYEALVTEFPGIRLYA